MIVCVSVCICQFCVFMTSNHETIHVWFWSLFSCHSGQVMSSDSRPRLKHPGVLLGPGAKSLSFWQCSFLIANTDAYLRNDTHISYEVFVAK
jgi:hypothetical protein